MKHITTLIALALVLGSLAPLTAQNKMTAKEKRTQTRQERKIAQQKVKEEFNWNKIAQDTHYIYEQAICKTMSQRQAEQIAQEKAKKATKAKNTDKEITNLLSFKKKHAYA